MTDINHMLQVFEDCLTVNFSSALLLFHDPPPLLLCKVGDGIRYIYDGQKVRKPCMRVSHLSHNWTQRRVTLWTILKKKKNNPVTLGQHWTNADSDSMVVARQLWYDLSMHRGCILKKTWFKKKKSLMTDITHTIYRESKAGGSRSHLLVTFCILSA